jgi:hypothetical protein
LREVFGVKSDILFSVGMTNKDCWVFQYEYEAEVVNDFVLTSPANLIPIVDSCGDVGVFL